MNETSCFMYINFTIEHNILTLILLNFLNELVNLPFFGTVHYKFWGQGKNLKLASRQDRVWIDCMEVLLTGGKG